jgi:hypothetical protein
VAKDDNPVLSAHNHSSSHRAEVMASEQCGCFYCFSIFGPNEITEWVDETDEKAGTGTTAICPHCGIDSVIGSRSGYPITRDFLEAMHKHWF